MGIQVACMFVRPNTSKNLIVVCRGVILNGRLATRNLKLRLGLGFAQASVPSPIAQSDQQTGPTLLTVGPWRPIFLHSYHTRISDLHISALVNESLDADLIVRIALSPSKRWTTAEVWLKDPACSKSGIVASQSNISLNNGPVQVVFHFENGEVKLWYPIRYGEQPLYEVQVRIYDGVRSLLILLKKLLNEAIVVARSVIG